MDASGDVSSGPGNCCGSGHRGSRSSPPSLFVPLSKMAVVARVLLTYAAVTCAALALTRWAGPVGTQVALGLLAIALLRIFLGAALLFEQAPSLEVDAWDGLRVRHAAIQGEAFAPWWSAVAVGWDGIERWEVAPATIAPGLPCPWGGSVLRVVLRRPEAFVVEHGRLWGRIRFTWKAFRHGTPLVVSEAVLRASVREIAEFMARVRPAAEEGPCGPGGFEVVPLPPIPLAVVVQ